MARKSTKFNHCVAWRDAPTRNTANQRQRLIFQRVLSAATPQMCWKKKLKGVPKRNYSKCASKLHISTSLSVGQPQKSSLENSKPTYSAVKHRNMFQNVSKTSRINCWCITVLPWRASQFLARTFCAPSRVASPSKQNTRSYIWPVLACTYLFYQS